MFKNYHKIYPFPYLLIILFVFGFLLIISSAINIFLINYFNNQKTALLGPKHNIHKDFFKFEENFENKQLTRLPSRFIPRDDLSIKDSIKGLLTNSYLDEDNYKKNNSLDNSKNLNPSNLQIVTLYEKMPMLNLQTLPSNLDLIKDVKIKKEKFIYSILSAVVQENEKIRVKRKKLLEIKAFLIVNKTKNA